jgi:RNA 2',3'-cyclic 3'-phosphodiesterase
VTPPTEPDHAAPSPPTKANWFLAFPIDGAPWFETLPPPPPGIRSFHPLDLHATIAFLGAVGEARALAAWAAFPWERCAELPRTVTLGEGTPLGPPGVQAYSALSALLVAGPGRAAVEGFIGEARTLACTHAGSPPGHDRHPPLAHVTLARPKRRASLGERAAGLTWLEALALPSRALSVRLDRVALYTWADDRKERLFTISRERFR